MISSIHTLPDRLMLTALAMSAAAKGRYSPDGKQYVTVEIDEAQRCEWEILPGEIDELERRGWAELLPPRPGAPEDQAEVLLTDRGGYWLGRWLKANRRRLKELLEKFRPGRRPDLAVEVTTVKGAA